MADRVRLDVPILLPDVPDAKDACVERLVDSLLRRNGILVLVKNETPAHLCIHYDPETVSLSRIRRTARSLGAEITDQYGHVSWSVQGLSHPRRARTVSKRLRTLDGILEVKAGAADRIRAEYDRVGTRGVRYSGRPSFNGDSTEGRHPFR